MFLMVFLCLASIGKSDTGGVNFVISYPLMPRKRNRANVGRCVNRDSIFKAIAKYSLGY